MKKLITLLIGLFLFVPFAAFAAGTITQAITSDRQYGPNNAFRAVTLSCTGDAANGTLPATALSTAILATLHSGGYALFKVQTYPGGVAPTDASDMTITDGTGADILGGNGANQIDATSKLEFYPLIGATPVLQPVIGTWTVNITQQAVATNSATFTVVLIFVKY